MYLLILQNHLHRRDLQWSYRPTEEEILNDYQKAIEVRGRKKLSLSELG